MTDDKAFAQSNTVLYRLKMVDNDGSFTYSKVITVQQQRTGGFSRLKIYPNPTQNTLNLTIDAPNAAIQTVDIIDVVGKVWQHKTLNLLRGQNQDVLDVQSLPTGIYFLQMVDSQGIKNVLRFVKQ